MCNCKAEIEAQLLERFKAKYPDAQDHRVSLQGYVFAISGNTMTLHPYMPIKYGARHTNKKTGREVWKNEKGNMVFSFCPFCGQNFAKDAP
jgi:hypothetical protein